MENVCTACLCTGRNLYYIGETDYYDIYTQILNEIPVYDLSQICVRICWECRAHLRRYFTFKQRAKRSYCDLLKYLQNPPPKFPPTNPPNLQIQLITRTSYPYIKTEVIPDNLYQEQGCQDLGIHEQFHEFHQDTELCLDVEDIKDEVEETHSEPATFVKDLKVKGLKKGIKHKLKQTRHKKKTEKPKVKKIRRVYISSEAKKNDEEGRIDDILEGDGTDENLPEDRIHDNKFKCKDCDKSFRCKREYKMHYVEEHVQVTSKFPPTNPYIKSEEFPDVTHAYEDLDIHQFQDDFHQDTELGAEVEDVKDEGEAYSESMTFVKDSKVKGQKRGIKHKLKKTPKPTVKKKRRTSLSSKEESMEIEGEDSVLEGDREENLPEDRVYENQFKCKDCDMSFCSKKEYKMHYEEHVKDKSSAARGTVNGTARPREVLPERPECAECGKVFSSKKTYRYHINVLHKGQNQYPCPRCGKVYQWKSNLGRHMRSHRARDSGELWCGVCEKRFASVATYRQHLRVSRRHVTESEYSFMCNECGKKFVSKTRLRDHIDWDHLKKIKFRCQLCNKPFKCHTSVYVHMQNVHKNKEKKDNLCHVCGKSYQNAAKLKYHITAMHTSETPYQCAQCSAAFGWYSSLYRHVREVHYKMKLQPKKVKKNKKLGESLPPLLLPQQLPPAHA